MHKEDEQNRMSDTKLYCTCARGRARASVCVCMRQVVFLFTKKRSIEILEGHNFVSVWAFKRIDMHEQWKRTFERPAASIICKNLRFEKMFYAVRQLMEMGKKPPRHQLIKYVWFFFSEANHSICMQDHKIWWCTGINIHKYRISHNIHFVIHFFTSEPSRHNEKGVVQKNVLHSRMRTRVCIRCQIKCLINILIEIPKRTLPSMFFIIIDGFDGKTGQKEIDNWRQRQHWLWQTGLNKSKRMTVHIIPTVIQDR